MNTATIAMADKYKVVNGTSYHTETPDAVIRILESSRAWTQARLILIYGDALTGKPWGPDATPNRGHVGRSTGTSKIPLLIRTRRSTGGEAILDHCIVEIRTSIGNKVLYKMRFEALA